MPEHDPQREALHRIIGLAQQWSGCDFARYNEGTLERRITRRMIDVRSQTMADYNDYLNANPAEYPRLISALTVKVSQFFRDPEVFSFVDAQVLPVFYQKAHDSGQGSIRVWSAACARGEEAYSIAILLAERNARHPRNPVATTILATDLDPDCLSAASEGVYPSEELKHVSGEWRNRYFQLTSPHRAGAWKVGSELRRMVSFATFDLTHADRLSPPSGIFCEYDLILCRNMLIYCQHSLKLDIIRKIYCSLGPGGHIVLGRSETMPDEWAPYFQVVDQRLKIFLKKESA